MADTGEKQPLEWVVHDLCGWAPRAKGIGEDEPSFGPMTEQTAREMVARRPDFYYARRLGASGSTAD